MNFGPINQTGGERRLNVAFSRAKQHLAMVSSIRHPAITNDYNDGARCLKNYLRYAEAMSLGDTAAMDRVLRELAWDRGAAQAGGKDDAVIGAVAAAFDAVTSSSCRLGPVSLSLRPGRTPPRRFRPSPRRHRRYRRLLPTEGPRRARDVLKVRLLRSFGWKVAHVLTKDWHEKREQVMQQLATVVVIPTLCQRSGQKRSRSQGPRHFML